VLEFERYIDHVESCGNKTTPCNTCNAYVRNKEREDHLMNGGCEKEKDKQKMKDFLAAEKAKEQIEKFRLEEE
jgi:hypothetical protein